ncbi:hypothetical protein CAPTEDRAFT_224554 [Capitella teleta]|uniref:RCK N-terminal domain-containing protein n=1 Tax=Capitella teleta TaxID=283909 RepID=R7V9X8_CAPTE|nr:hypothetical protein CAPTEDRAFT_224554 [Capitella teleta]|eukprot:ELU15404.1 hypothetical protein CAPTEDRAFT_224554 [Capitella teleta]
MKLILQVPIWAARVIYIQGSALKDTDLSRCRIQDAEACFMIAVRNYRDRAAADQHTILRSWAVKDFAPHCPQYVQVFRPENKIHVHFAEHVVCEDEFKYALFADNCLCPGISTLLALLLHTSRGAEGQTSSEDWIKRYGKYSGNEIYSIKLGDSRFFGEYDGKSFTYASFHAHRKYGVALVGIRQEMPGSTIQLNPGPRHIMKTTDLCFYMSITKEENSAFILAHPNEDKEACAKQGLGRTASYNKMAGMIASVVKKRRGDEPPASSHALYDTETGKCAPLVNTEEQPLLNEDCFHEERTAAKELKQTFQRSQSTTSSAETPTGSGPNHLELPSGVSMQKRPSIAPVPAYLETNGLLQSPYAELSDSDDSDSDKDVFDSGDPGEPDYVRGFPPTTPYVGTSPTLCHLMKEKRTECCIQLAHACDHCSHTHAKDYHWRNRAIIVAADYASNGLYNFIVPLRSHACPKSSLNPIVLLLEKKPDQNFLETICFFPMVYWMIGSIDSLDDLLRCGITQANNVVIVNKETSNALDEEILADCNTIVAVQTIFRLFPSANIITELSQANNMRFMQFKANDHYALQLSKLEKKEKDRGSHLYYMFRLPFAAGNVFSASMLDTLLYQAFVKDYLITFVRLLLGIDQAVGSGHLHCMKIKREDLWIRTFGRLYQRLCSTTCEVPIGIYRTQMQASLDHATATRNFKRSFRRHMRRRLGSHNHEYLSVSMATEGGCEEGNNGNLAVERQEINQMVKCRMSTLGIPLEDYDEISNKRNTISYVIINPSYDLELAKDDIIYLIRPSSLSPQPSPLVDERKTPLRKNVRREEPPGAERGRSSDSGSSLTPDSHAVSPLQPDDHQTPLLRLETDFDASTRRQKDARSHSVDEGIRGTVV